MIDQRFMHLPMGQVAPIMPLQLAIHVVEAASPVTGPAFVVLVRIRPQLDYHVSTTSLKTAGRAVERILAKILYGLMV
jgi:hypothetical protein